MAGKIDILASLKTHYTTQDPPVTKDTEPDFETARKAKRWVVREHEVRELLATAVTEAVTRTNELVVARYPEGSMHCVPPLIGDTVCASWLAKWKPKAEDQIAKFEGVVPAFDELQAYATS